MKILQAVTSWGSGHSYYFLLLPAAMGASVILVKYLAPDAKGHGTEKVIEAVHKNSGRIKPMVVPVKLLATLVTLAAGGSVGKEGPCAQIGAGLCSAFADLFRFNATDRKKLVICGISAGFAAVFGTPVSGAMFGVEVLFVGSILYEALLPSFVAGIIGYQVSVVLGVTYFSHPIEFVPVFSEAFFLKVIGSGLFSGACALLLILGLTYADKAAKRLPLAEPLKGVLGGAALAGLAILFSTHYLGLGLEGIEANLQGGRAIWYAFLLKILFTSITLAFGGSGGIVTPIFFIGAASGALFGQVFGLDVATFSALGLVAVLSGAANTPIAATIMAMELFGVSIAPYAAVACVVSFLITGYRSVYPSQVLAISKSSSLPARLGKEIGPV